MDKNRKNSPYYKDGSFINIEAPTQKERQLEKFSDKGLWDVIKWKFFSSNDKDIFPNLKDKAPITQKIHPSELLATDTNLKITWLGHASTFISYQVDEKKIISIITDPIFTSPILTKRESPSPIKANQIPQVDAILISHAHLDHCDTDSILTIQKKYPLALVIFPEGMVEWAKDKGIKNVVILQWYETYKKDNLDITMLPAHHWSNRSLWDKSQYHWGSFLIKTVSTNKDNKKEKQIYFAGDTGMGFHFPVIAKKYPQGFDIAIMPIGAYAPRWFMKTHHMNPTEAVKASSILKSKIFLPIHWGTFRLTDEKLDEPILFLKQEIEKHNKTIRQKNNKIKAIYWVPGQSYDK